MMGWPITAHGSFFTVMRLGVSGDLIVRSATLLSFVGLGSSCEQVPLLAPTATTVTINASRGILPFNGSAQITATVIELGGTPVHDGTLVTFVTTLGALDPTEAQTRDGQAVVTLRAGTQSGIAEVSAFSGGAHSATSARVAIGAAAAAEIAVAASPGTVPAGGGTVTLIAKPTDANGNALPGVPVSFSADAGTLGARAVVSDSLGEARTTLTTDRDTLVTASVGGRTSTVTVRVNLAPTVTIAATGPPPRVGEPVSFTVTAAAGSRRIRQATVDFGDGTVRSLGALVGTTEVTHTYRIAGMFDVTATATDTAGETASVVTVLVVDNAAPLNVTVTAAPTTPQVGGPVTFTATVTQPAGTPAIDRYEWSFGDDSRVVTTGNTTSHAYDSAGRYVVRLRAVEQDGRTGTARIEVDVSPRPPLNVNLTADPLRPVVGDVVVFTAIVSGSTVPIARYEWDFGDGASVTSSGNVVNHVYRGTGTREAQVRAVAQDGQTGVGRTTVEVAPRAPLNVNLTADPLRATVGEVVVFTATVSGSTVPIARYEWNFGDGTRVTTTGNVVNHVYSTAGTRKAEVQAVDQDGQTGVGRATIEVTPRVPLNVNLTADPARPAAGDIVVFTATASGSTIPIARYEWDFGDGAEVTTTGNVVDHVYSTVGARQAQVQAVAQDGQTGIARTTVDVTPQAPLNVNLTADPTRAIVGDVVAFTATISGSTVPIARYEWNFGDGTRLTTTGSSVNHVYSTPGTRAAEVRAVDQNEQAAVGRTTIVVVARTPSNVNLTANPTRATVGDVVAFTATVSGSTVPIARYEWNFGDGTRLTTTGSSVNHVYSTSGTRTAEVRAVDQNGQVAVGRTTIVVVARTPLNVNLTADPPRPTAGEIVVFTATVSGSTVPIARYEWDFDDGITVTTTGNVVDHVYTTAGARTARVTVVSVEDDRGASQTTVLVAQPQLAVTLAVDPVVADAGQPVTFTATVSPATAVILRYEWSFGDAGENTANTTSPTTTFAYADADRGATRTVTVTAVAFDDTSVSTQGLVSINP